MINELSKETKKHDAAPRAVPQQINMCRWTQSTEEMETKIREMFESIFEYDEEELIRNSSGSQKIINEEQNKSQ